MSKAELRQEHMKASRGPMAATYVGMAIGLLLGITWFVIQLLRGRADFPTGVGILMAGMIGSAVGFLSAYLRMRGRSRGDGPLN
jgi:hypothetical protein